ncbi:MAG: hypothetical protein JZU65_16170 [Chlorobium sp.]|nr:hypothetical protein [Chlorobium sp.]
MKTFLEICKEVLSEAGLSGTGPSSVISAVGVEKRIVGWVSQAWLDVQQYRDDWPWMVKDFSFITSPDKDLYPLSELLLTDLERWEFSGASIYKTTDGKKAERPLKSAHYGVWWEKYRMGEQLTAEPGIIMAQPVDNALRLHPEPDAEYTVTLRYYRSLQILTSDADIPLMPPGSSWQDIIKWKSLLYYAFHDGAPGIATEAMDKWDTAIQAMDNRYGQDISFNMGTLA